MNNNINLPIKGVSIDWNKIDNYSYLRGIEAIKGLDYLSFNNNITIFVGENGSGKSTMLEAIAVNYGFNPEGGTKNYNFSTYDSHSELCDAIRLSRGFTKPRWGYFLRAESFYNVASAEEEYSRFGGVPEHFMSTPMGRAFFNWFNQTLKEMDYIYLMSQKQLYRLKDNLPYYLKLLIAPKKIHSL